MCVCAIVIQSRVLTTPLKTPQPPQQLLLTFRGMQMCEHSEGLTFQSELKQALFLCVYVGPELLRFATGIRHGSDWLLQIRLSLSLGSVPIVCHPERCNGFLLKTLYVI